MTPGVSILSETRQRQSMDRSYGRNRHTLDSEVLHNIQEDVVNINALVELDFDNVEVAKRIRDIELMIGNAIHIL
jgi:hypothetical protein